MMKRIMLFGTCLLVPFLAFTAQEQPQPASMTTSTTRQVLAREVNIKIDLLSDEQTQAGFNSDEIKDVIVHELDAAGVTFNEGISQPVLVLRIRTLQVGLDLATFFQLNLLEEAMLIRNRSLFQATTWSQASLLSCRPEELKKEVLDTVTVMTQAFAKDYTQAIQPMGK